MHTAESGPFLFYAYENQEERPPRTKDKILVEGQWDDGVLYLYLPQLDIEVKPVVQDSAATMKALVKAVFGFYEALRDLPESHITEVEELQRRVIEDRFISWFQDMAVRNMQDQADEPLRELVAG